MFFWVFSSTKITCIFLVKKRKLEKEKNKYLIQEKIQKLKYAIDIDATINIKKIQNILNNSRINKFCDLSLKNEDNKYIYKSNNNVFEVNKIKLNTWITYEKPKINKLEADM